MAGKFVDVKEAATMIGVSPEELVEMRSRGDIFGYRDGASWKFKTEEVERVVRERGVEARGGDSAVLTGNDDEFENLITGLSSKILAEKAQEESESGSVLISEEQLGVSTTGQSTIIGKGLAPAEAKASDSDLRLADDSGKELLTPGGSDKLLEAPGSILKEPSASDVLHGSDIKPAGGSGTGDMPLQKPGSTGGLELGENLALGDEGDLEIGSSDSVLDDEIRPKKGSAIGSAVGSDVTLGTGDSGINIASPADSGLSLEEEPIDLGGSGVESLELPEDEEVIAAGADADLDQPTQKADNEFLLSAAEGMPDDESDSGSQVIALEDSESFDQDAATMIKTDQGAALADDAFQPVEVEEAGAVAEAGAAGQPVYVQTAVAEAPYSVWNVISLGLVAGMLALSGMMMVDVIFNMWSFNEPSSISTGIMDSFMAVLGK